MVDRRAAALMRAGGQAIGIFISTEGILSTEAVARAGYDFLLIDTQHGAANPASLIGQIQAASVGGASPWVRIPWNDPAAAMRALDCGAEAVICPMIETVADVERFVGACRYQPEGYRSFGPFRSMMVDGGPRDGFEARSNADQMAIAMIETMTALDAVEQIARVPNLSGLYVGPSDLGAVLGTGAHAIPTDPKVYQAFDRVVAAAKAAGIPAGVHCGDSAMAKAMLARGFAFVTVSTELSLLAQAAKAGVAALRG